MKRTLIALSLGLAACATSHGAAKGSTAAPAPAPKPMAQAAEPADPAPVTDGDVTLAQVGGMRVLVKRVPSAEFVAGQLYILGGVRDWTAQTAGVEALAMQLASHGGTQSLDKDAFAERLAQLGSDLEGDATNDYSLLACKALTANWAPTFALLADAFLHPALPALELSVVRAQQLSQLRHEHEDPDGALSLLVHNTIFAGHPYANRAEGTLQTVPQITLAQITAQLQTLRERSRLLLVVVGNVDPAQIIDQAKQAFGALPRGDFVLTPLPALSLGAPKLVTEQRTLPTNYVMGVYTAPGWGDANFPAGLVGTSLLSYRVFEEVRTKRNLSYAPSAGLSGATDDPLGYLYVTAVDPNTTYAVMLDQAKKLASTTASDAEVTGTKSLFLTGFLRQNQTVDGQAGMLARAVIFGGDWHLERTLPDRIRAVSAADIQAFAKKYVHHLQTLVLGNPAKVDPKLFQSL